MDSTFYKQLEDDAKQWVTEAGSILVSHEHDFTVAKQKDEVDVSTSADTEVEQFLTKRILEKYPDHAIYGEEFGLTKKNAAYVWSIDPLDNTKEYVRGIGEYNCLLAVEENGILVAGIVQRFGPAVCYTTSKGNGALLDGKPIRVSTTSNLNVAFIGTNTANNKVHTADEIDRFCNLSKEVISDAYRIRPGADDAKLFGWVAQGAFDASISLPKSNKWFDVAPAILLVEEAGGKVTDWLGNPIQGHDLSKGILVSNSVLHETLLPIVKKFI